MSETGADADVPDSPAVPVPPDSPVSPDPPVPPDSSVPPDPPVPPDPWKGLRGVMSAILILEAMSVLFCLMVVTKISGNGGAGGVAIVLVLVIGMVAACKFLARPWGIRLVVGLQVATIVSGLVVPVLGALGVIFGLVWVAILAMRRDVARKMALGELPSQQPR